MGDTPRRCHGSLPPPAAISSPLSLSLSLLLCHRALTSTSALSTTTSDISLSAPVTSLPSHPSLLHPPFHPLYTQPYTLPSLHPLTPSHSTVNSIFLLHPSPLPLCYASVTHSSTLPSVLPSIFYPIIYRITHKDPLHTPATTLPLIYYSNPLCHNHLFTLHPTKHSHTFHHHYHCHPAITSPFHSILHIHSIHPSSHSSTLSSTSHAPCCPFIHHATLSSEVIPLCNFHL